MLGFGCFRELPFKLFIVNTSTHTLDYAMAGFVLTYLQTVSFSSGKMESAHFQMTVSLDKGCWEEL